MAINPAIALGVRGVEVQDPLTQYSRVAALQSAQQQNALAQMQMQQAQTEMEERNKLREFLPTLTSENRNELLKYGTAGRQAYESMLKGEKETREAEKASADVAAARMKQARDLLPSVNSPEAYANWRTYTLQNLPGLANVIPQQYSPETTRNLMLEADKALEQHFVSQNLGGTARVVAMPKYGQGPAQTVAGSEAQVSMTPGEAERIRLEGQRIGLEGQRIGLEGRRVAVAEENARREADPAFQQRMEAARTVGRKAAEGDVAAIQALPKVIGDAELAVGILDQMVGKRDPKTGKLLTKDPVTGELLKDNKPHPGFTSAVGMGGFGTLGVPGIAQMVPGTDAANFKTLYKQITGVAFLEAFETLKGGGAITEKESDQATAARNRMSLAQSEDEFIRAALEYREIIAKGLERAQAKAARATTRMAPTTPSAPAASGVKFLGFE